MTLAIRPRALAPLLFAFTAVAANPLPALPGFALAARGQEPNPDEAPTGVPEGEIMEEPGGQVPDEAAPRRGRARSRGPARKGAPTRARAEAAPKPAEEAAKSADAPAPKAEAPAAGPSFARDVAPVLVAAGCIDCHSPGRPGFARGKLDMGSFEKFMKGGGSGPAAAAGKPDESHLILRVRGDEEPRMPPGDDARLGEPAVAAISAWIQAGAKLDDGLDPKAPIKSYAASPQDLAKSKLAEMPAEARDAKVTQAGLERWKKANPELKPEIETTEHFALFTTLPKDRAASTLKSIETQLPAIRRVLGPEVIDRPEKISFYAFSDRKDYVEFLRTVKQREVDEEEEGDADLRTAQPYVVVVAPPDAPAASATGPRRKTRGRRDADAPEGSGRTLAGLLIENLGRGAVLANGSSPRWLAEGLGVYLAGSVERRSPYQRKLRVAALDAFKLGWPTRASDVLGGGEQVSPEEFRGVSFALVECLTSPHFRPLFGDFLTGMSKGGDKLDDVIKDVYGADRETFLNETGDWVASTYGGAD
ncbi:c-type cytochrome domain-containing protein [Planctomyces sp. SH-PL62]|uniref:c-type cytochrome domain-containing protein n=1 Tax=Planctomyces sp. SH-PL62 TaxID=1636152 RepID=UPI00078E6C58|nr:c-type cytochrome domain-containing protein [Planctomyces sp. SH-PL62]AMV40114.1 Planctomycete cytochrome C [Planctomyces sp. SH-PL62]